jgi:hypothetical protein
MKTEIVVNLISKYKGPEYPNCQNYREQYVGDGEDNRDKFDEFVVEDLETLKTDTDWPHVPAEASPLTCGTWSKNNGR